MSIDVREFWNFDDPQSSEVTFRGLLGEGDLNPEDRLEVIAQIARTFSLRRDCPQCHAILDEHWDEAMVAGPRAKASFELERGRAFRTGKDIPSAMPFFESAATSEAEDLKVDALHMLAIVAEPEESNRINLEALKIAEASSNPWAFRWQGTLCNNLGWSAFETGRFEEAVGYFKRALDERKKYGNRSAINVASWCLGRGLRAAGDLETAETIQRELAEVSGDGYAFEEMAEIMLEKGDPEAAKPYAKQAIEKLVEVYGEDSDKIRRLREISGP